MQIQDSTLTDRAPDKDPLDRNNPIQQTDDIDELAWLFLPQQTQGAIVWPRIFPGL
jgi:hypothetical protein